MTAKKRGAEAATAKKYVKRVDEYVVLARKVGNSIVVTIPAVVSHDLQLESGEKMLLTWDGEEITVRKY